ncbi:MAG: hypothetical protein ACK4IY_00035 [Chitinophagales bacterium]
MLNDEQLRRGHTGIAIMLSMIVLMITPMGIAALFSGAWYFGLPLCIASGLILWSIRAHISRGKKKTSEPKLFETHPTQLPAASPEKDAAPIAHWLVDNNTWKIFMQAEKKLRNEDSAYFFIGTLIVGCIGLMSARHLPFFRALPYAAAIGLLIVLLRRYFALRNLQNNKNQAIPIIISKDKIQIKEQVYSLIGENRWISGIQLKNAHNTDYIEFTIEWSTRNGNTFDELRIPVPEGKFAEAEKVIQHFTKTHIQ